MSDAICSVISIVWSRVLSAGAVRHRDEGRVQRFQLANRAATAGGRLRGSSAGRTRRRTSVVRCPDTRAPCVTCGQRTEAVDEAGSADAATVAECAPCPARPTRSSSSAPDSAGCPRRCTWPARAATSRWSSGPMFPAVAPDCIQDDGYTFDTGPTVLTMPDLVARPLAAVGESADRLAPATSPRSGLSRPVRRRLGHRRARRSGRDGRRDRAGLRRRRRRRLPPLRRATCASCMRVEMPHFIDRNLDSPRATARARRCCGWCGLGGFRRLAPKVGQLPAGRAACAGSSPSRRCTPGSPRPRRWRSTP